ncbi:unnamed protein product [Anisakis simplex]|uniref:Uncharacterized protein n=1 Tax=Anisakis simplex TaxID=6269 RepID=A0A0M3JQK3_ANISI|nr:unnamed protein product [Anisakis simplex]
MHTHHYSILFSLPNLKKVRPTEAAPDTILTDLPVQIADLPYFGRFCVSGW